MYDKFLRKKVFILPFVTRFWFILAQISTFLKTRKNVFFKNYDTFTKQHPNGLFSGKNCKILIEIFFKKFIKISKK